MGRIGRGKGSWWGSTAAVAVGAVLMLLGGIIAPPLAGQDVPARAIEGTVTATEGGEPLPGVTVEVVELDRRVLTDETGRYRFGNVLPGRYTLRFHLIGRAVMDRPLEVPADRAGRLSVSLDAAPLSVRPFLVLMERTRLSEGIERGRVPGSVHVIGPASLRDRPVVFDDIHTLLREVPGVNVQEEDGFGLRPNIGMRGTGVERSGKITVMEDGVLAAPAPYAAPAAYYFPVAGRMSAIEVRKGSSQIRYGPNTIGGAINLVSSPIPSSFSIFADAAGGSEGAQKLHARVGDSGPRVGWMFEAYRVESDGFKRLDGGGSTGFDIQDYLGKVRVSTAPGARVYQELELKLGWYDERSDETYLGLTAADFVTSPDRRYAASQEDVMNADHRQLQLRHFLRFPAGIDLTTTAYRNTFARAWYKLQSVSGTGLASVLSDPSRYADELAILRGQASSDDALTVRANNREYLSRGIQTVAGLELGEGITHALEVGFRVHEDEEDRFQQEDRYGMQSGRMVLASEGAPGSQANRISSASAVAFHLQDRMRIGRLTLTPGVRHESIDFMREDFAPGDGDRAEPTGVRENSVSAWIPGIGGAFDASSDLQLFGGLHRGFGPPGPGADQETRPESSVNYEAGIRLRTDAAALTVTGFFSDYDNVLGRATLATGEDGSNEIFNGGEVRASGLEVSGSAAIRPERRGDLRIPLSLAYTLTRATFETAFESDYGPWGTVEPGDRLPYLPTHQLFASVGVQGDRWSGRLTAAATSASRTVAGQGAIPDDARADAFFVLGLGVDVELARGATAYLAAENLTDTRYVAARRPAGLRPGLPRTLQLGLRIER